MSMTAADRKNLNFVLEGLKGSWERMSHDQRAMIKTLVEMISSDHSADDEENMNETIASLYQPLTREEMLASIDRGLAEAERGEGKTLEESAAGLAAEFGFTL